MSSSLSAQVVHHAARPKERTSEEMLFVGQSCSHGDCHLVDFLPFKCTYCDQPFCASHFGFRDHACPRSPPAHTLDRIAPLCPICSTPISSLPGQDPNEPMERHIMRECQGVQDKKHEMKRKREEGKVCWRKGCGKVLFSPISCDLCKHKFCPADRYPKDHKCEALAQSSKSTDTSRSASPAPVVPSTSTSSTTKKLISTVTSSLNKANLAGSGSSNSPKGALTKETSAAFEPEWKTASALPSGPRRDAALAALRRQNPQAAAKMSASESTMPSASSSAQSPSSSSSHNFPKLSKRSLMKSPTDKLAKAEWESTFKSLANRNNKGLLSEKEKEKYAEMVAMKEKARRNGKGDCIVS